MKVVLKKILLVLFLGLFFGTTACKKSDSASPDATIDETTAIQSGEADQIVNDAIATADDAMDGNFDGIGNGRVESCGNINLNIQQKSVNIDFGTGCAGVWGKNRSGKITVSFSDNQRNITFQNYVAEGYTISGTITQSNITKSGNVLSYNTSASNLAIVNASRKITITSLQRKTEINLGSNPRQIADNEIRITGTCTGINNNNESFTTEITTPLLIKLSCAKNGIFYPVGGTSLIKIVGKPNMTIDYGSGTCDKQITVTVGSIVRTITLP
ncbi:MAG: hypothetical protein EAZ08_12570 [Cytophagales bacterium]|nr:MAG: hypothetical protein EAZ08_12570 [Cytophagales bacterium]